MNYFMPNNIQIELVEGCNRMCRFCGIWGIWREAQHRTVNYMTIPVAQQLAQSLCDWGFHKKRVEFAMHGEPTLHPYLVRIIKYFRKKLPLAQLQITTNGMVMQREKKAKLINDLFEAGLNILLVDTYDGHKKFCELIPSLADDIRVLAFHEQTDFNPYYYKDSKSKTICIFGDLGSNSGEKKQRTIINHAGNADAEVMKNEYSIMPVEAPLKKNCSKPFREMIIHWDGTVPVCCLDWKHEHIIGKFPEQSMQDIWEGENFSLVRQAFSRKLRPARPCYKCNHKGGFRLGLLPKPIGFNAMSDWAITKAISFYLKKTSKYCHPTTTNPILYQPDKAGISRFLKGK